MNKQNRRIRVRTTVWYRRNSRTKFYGVQARIDGKWLDVVDSQENPVTFTEKKDAELHRLYVKRKLDGATNEEAVAYRQRMMKVINRSTWNQMAKAVATAIAKNPNES
jgi:hypothetical protein